MADPRRQRDDRVVQLSRSGALGGALRQARTSAGDLVRRTPRRVRVAAPLAVAATVGAVGLGLVTTGATTTEAPTAALQAIDASDLLADRDDSVSRSDDRAELADPAAAQLAAAALADWTAERTAALAQQAQRAAEARQAAADAAAAAELQATAAAVAAADTVRWTTADLNLHTTAGEGAEVAGVVEEGAEVLVTGRTAGGREEIVWEEASRWVSAGYLTDEDPTALSATSTSPGGVAARSAGGTCSNGSSTPSGVTANVADLHEAVCAAFPEITNYGGTRTDGDHGRGLALDIMVSGATGWEVAEFVRANYTDFDVNYVIYEQKIWSVDRSGEGWRSMEDRGSATANHMDHVHVSVY